MLDRKSESEVERLADLEWNVLMPKVEEALEAIMGNNQQFGEEVKRIEKQIGFVKQINREYIKENPNFEKTRFHKELNSFLEKLDEKVNKMERMKETGEAASILLMALLSKVKRDIKSKDHMDKFKAD
jgi:hypothetical protein